VALEPVGGGDAADHPFIPVGTTRTARINTDGTFTPVVNITAQSALYGVEFTFTITAEKWDGGLGYPLTAEKASQVDEVCGHAHVQDFYTQTDQGPSQVLYNFAHIVVGTDSGAITDEAVVRMDHLGDQSTYAKIDQVWKRLTDFGAS